LKVQGQYVTICLLGGGDLHQFEDIGRAIINSIRVTPHERADALANCRGVKTTKRRTLSPISKRHLAEVLALLPEPLEYLRGPILALADEDQDMLGTGGADTAMLAEAIEQQAAMLPSGFAVRQAEELEKWLASHATREEAWAAPVRFVLAFLMGYDMFGEKQTRTQ
jgi:hypothetical protein